MSVQDATSNSFSAALSGWVLALKGHAHNLDRSDASVTMGKALDEFEQDQVASSPQFLGSDLMEDSAAKERTSVLVLCTGNSARSILCEALLRERGAGRLAAYSAGSQPKAEPHNEALRLLASRGHAINGFRSKSWDEFALPGAPELDVVITVCDSAASESCPVWPGAPVTAHWGIPDPAGAPQDRLEAEFAIAYKRLSRRVDAFVGLPFEEMGAEELKRKLNEIGQFDL